MRAVILSLTCALMVCAESPPRVPAPFYTPSTIVNGASFKPGPLAPNTIATLFGRDLAFKTRELSNEDLYNGTLPTTLLGTGVRLVIDGSLAYIYYVSPTQINFLVPSTLTPGVSEIQLVLDGQHGEAVRIPIAAASPALFMLDPETALATHVDGSVVKPGKPAHPGEIVVLYATGLGATRPRLPAGQIPTAAAWLERKADFQITLNGERVTPADVQYVGAAPGFAGLYQINVKLPLSAPRNPELRIGFEEGMSPAGVRLVVEHGNP